MNKTPTEILIRLCEKADSIEYVKPFNDLEKYHIILGDKIYCISMILYSQDYKTYFSCSLNKVGYGVLFTSELIEYDIIKKYILKLKSSEELINEIFE